LNRPDELKYAKSVCPACFDDPQLDEKLLKNAIDYAMALPEDICVGKGEYEKRLRVCSDCENLSRGVCGRCGCFVLVRARRKNKSCPLDDDRWQNI
jgi:hypothetical protein